jgi:hypothetical protein
MSDPQIEWPCLAPDRAKFAAREYVARVEREAGLPYAPDVRDQVTITYEIGYLRGANEAYDDLAKMRDELMRVARETGRLEGEHDRLLIEKEALRRETELILREKEALQQVAASRRELDELMARIAALESGHPQKDTNR